MIALNAIWVLKLRAAEIFRGQERSPLLLFCDMSPSFGGKSADIFFPSSGNLREPTSRVELFAVFVSEPNSQPEIGRQLFPSPGNHQRAS